MLLGILGACASRPHVVRLDISYAAEARRKVKTRAVPQVGHAQEARAIAVLPGGGLVATAADDVRLWDGETGRLRAVLPAQGSSVAVTSLAFEGMERALVIARESGRIERWDPFTGRVSLVVEDTNRPVLDHRAFFGSAGSLGLMHGHVGGNWTWWSLGKGYDGQLLASFAGAYGAHRVAVGDAAGGVFFGEVDRNLSTVVEPTLAREVDATNPHWDIQRHGWKVAVSDSGRLLAGARDDDVIVWKAEDWPGRERVLRRVTLLSQACGCLAEGSEVVALRYFDEELVVVDAEGRVTLIDHDGDAHPWIEPDEPHSLGTLTAFSGAGATLAHLTGSGELEVWDLLARTRRSQHGVPRPPTHQQAVAFTETGDAIRIAGHRTAETWSLVTRTIERSDVALPEDVRRTLLSKDEGLAPEPDALERAATMRVVSPDGTKALLFVPATEHGAPHRLVLREQGGKHRVTRAGAERFIGGALSPDGFVVAAVDEHEGVWLLEAATLQPMARFTDDAPPTPEDPWQLPTLDVEYGAAGTLAFARPTGELVLVGLDGGERSVLPLGAEIIDVAFSGDGRRLAALADTGPWIVSLGDDGEARRLALVRGDADTFGAMRPDGFGDAVTGREAPHVLVGSPYGGHLLDPAEAVTPSDPDLLSSLVASVPWSTPPTPPIPAELRIQWLYGWGDHHLLPITVLPGSRPVQEVCVVIATVDPVNEHTMCLRGETRREIRLPGRPNVVRAYACEQDGACTHAIVDQFDVSGEDLLDRLDR